MLRKTSEPIAIDPEAGGTAVVPGEAIFVVKVQRSILDSEGVRKILIYNQDRSVLFEHAESELPTNVRELLERELGADWTKFYTQAAIDANGDVGLAFGERLPEQPW
jgi:hypothetical protein